MHTDGNLLIEIVFGLNELALRHILEPVWRCVRLGNTSASSMPSYMKCIKPPNRSVEVCVCVLCS